MWPRSHRRRTARGPPRPGRWSSPRFVPAGWGSCGLQGDAGELAVRSLRVVLGQRPHLDELAPDLVTLGSLELPRADAPPLALHDDVRLPRLAEVEPPGRGSIGAAVRG